jgi:cytoskeletal protein RodZ
MATVLQHGPGAVQFGELLRNARERRGLTLQQVSAATKIPRRHLDAIEHGDLSVVPDGPYRRGEVRAIAQAIGLDQSVAIAHLDEALGTTVREQPAPPRDDTTPARVRLWLAVSAAVIVAIAAVAIWPRARFVEPAPAAAEQASPDETRRTPPEQPKQAAIAPASAVPATTVASPPSSAPAAAVVSPVLVVTTEPAGARVVVDGIGRGATPLTIQYLPLGEKRVRVVRDGYVSEERRVRLMANQPATTLHIELRPAR